ncbi:MAG: hypothetical protein ACLFN8_04800 [Candidatus Woesearchaeota archaeon]
MQEYLKEIKNRICELERELDEFESFRQKRHLGLESDLTLFNLTDKKTKLMPELKFDDCVDLRVFDKDFLSDSVKNELSEDIILAYEHRHSVSENINLVYVKDNDLPTYSALSLIMNSDNFPIFSKFYESVSNLGLNTFETDKIHEDLGREYVNSKLAASFKEYHYFKEKHNKNDSFIQNFLNKRNNTKTSSSNISLDWKMRDINRKLDEYKHEFNLDLSDMYIN